MKTIFTVLLLTFGTTAGMYAVNLSNLSPGMKVAVATEARGESRASAGQTQYIGAFITVTPDADLSALERLGVKLGVKAGNIVTARIPLYAVTDVAATTGVEYVDAAGPVTPMLDKAKAATGIPYEMAGEDATPVPCTGKGVVLGVIDAGFDYIHEAFRDKNKKCRIARVWEQASSSPMFNAPEKFGYGIELTEASHLDYAQGDITGNSHGTHVTGIAAGSGEFRDGAYKGIAEDTEIVLVSMSSTTGDNANLSDAIAYIFDYAQAVGKPCVINMSLGAQSGPHDGTSPFDVIADNLAGPGRLLVGSAGNHGADKFHVSRALAPTDVLGTFIDFKSSVSHANIGGTVEVWGEPGMKYRMELVCYSQGKGEVVETLTVDMDASEAKAYSFSSNVSGPLTVAVDTNPNNDKLHAVIKSGIYSLRSRYYVGIRILPEMNGTVDIWADNIQLGLSDNDIEGYTGPSADDPTIAEIGGTASSVLTVGAYTTRDEYTVFGGTSTNNIGQKLGDICTFSSFGPTADGRQKPEITAPGCFIISAVSSHDNSGLLIIADVNENGTYRYGYMQGTSMASPFVAGVVATWLQLNPSLDPESLHEIATKTAVTDDYTAAGNPIRWGAGKINPRGGAVEVLKSCGVVPTFADGTNQGALISPSEVLFTCSGTAKIIVMDASGRTVSEAYRDVTEGDTFSLTRDVLGVDRGLYIVTVSTPLGSISGKVLL